MTASRAFLFPGQGAQHAGMASDLVESHPRARAVFEAGREILGRDLLSICRDGPEDELHSTRTSQPAIFLHSMAALEVLASGPRFGQDPDSNGRFCVGVAAAATAGLSLGEYSALVFAGSLEFEDALRIVGKRGELMQEACDAEPGGMSSILGLDAPLVEDVVQTARVEGLRVGVANYNSPAQTVISGEKGAVAEVAERLLAAGARRAVPLTVAGAYHSELMASATAKLEPLLREVTVRPPRCPFFANFTGAEVSDPEEIRTGLIRQVESPVRWRQTLEAMVDLGVTEAYEVGPGKVIRGLVRNVTRDLEVTSVGTAAELAAP